MRHKNLFRKVLSVALATSLTLSNYSGVIASDVYTTESEVVESENINEEDPVVDYDYVNETGSEDLGTEPQSSESTESNSDQEQGDVSEEPLLTHSFPPNRTWPVSLMFPLMTRLNEALW